MLNDVVPDFEPRPVILKTPSGQTRPQAKAWAKKVAPEITLSRWLKHKLDSLWYGQTGAILGKSDRLINVRNGQYNPYAHDEPQLISAGSFKFRLP